MLAARFGNSAAPFLVMFNIIYVQVESALVSFGSCVQGSILKQINTITNSLSTLSLLEVRVW